jgi:hypothetical protein
MKHTDDPQPPFDALLRHFADLRDGTHGGTSSRSEKEVLFAAAVELLEPYAGQVLDETNRYLLRGTGERSATGLGRVDGGLVAQWLLSWPEQRAAELPALAIVAHYGRALHHPHLRGVTVGDWPLNVFGDADAAAELPTLRSIVAADIHNLVFQRDYRIIPATVAG